jgi:hypothetical protein
MMPDLIRGNKLTNLPTEPRRQVLEPSPDSQT